MPIWGVEEQTVRVPGVKVTSIVLRGAANGVETLMELRTDDPEVTHVYRFNRNGGLLAYEFSEPLSVIEPAVSEPQEDEHDERSKHSETSSRGRRR